MRVLHVIPSLSVADGGTSVAIQLMERALTREGVHVETITTDDEGPQGRNGKGDGGIRHENGVLRRYFRRQTDFYKVSLPLARWLASEVKRFDAVHVHALFSHTSIAAARAARQAGIPYIIAPHGVLNRYGVTQRRAMLKRLSLKWVEGPVLRHAAAVQFTLDDERAEAEQLGVAFQSIVVPLGLEDAVLTLPNPKAPPQVLYLSRIDPKKNIECLLEAWARIRPEHSDWQLVVAGSGEQAYLAKLVQYANSLGLGSCIQWLGQVGGEQKARLLADAAIFTLPSFSENFGIAAAEALLVGKPCVFTPGVGVGALAAKHGAARLAQPTASSLGAALRDLMNDEPGRRALSSEAKRFATSELSAAVMGQRLKAAYEHILSRPRL